MAITTTSNRVQFHLDALRLQIQRMHREAAGTPLKKRAAKVLDLFEAIVDEPCPLCAEREPRPRPVA